MAQHGYNGERFDPSKGDMSYDLIVKERDEYQREAAAANAELFSVLKKQEYRSADELALVGFIS
jgi:hypothetical protein